MSKRLFILMSDDDSLMRLVLGVANITSAETVLLRMAESWKKQTAEYFNLLGVLYEAQAKWRLARKCYGKAIAADKHFAPAQTNMRRLYELENFGESEQPISLGDEAIAVKLTDQHQDSHL